MSKNKIKSRWTVLLSEQFWIIVYGLIRYVDIIHCLWNNVCLKMTVNLKIWSLSQRCLICIVAVWGTADKASAPSQIPLMLNLRHCWCWISDTTEAQSQTPLMLNLRHCWCWIADTTVAESQTLLMLNLTHHWCWISDTTYAESQTLLMPRYIYALLG